MPTLPRFALTVSLLAPVACRPQGEHRHDASADRTADASRTVTTERASTGAPGDAQVDGASPPPTAFALEPRWQCMLTGSGRGGIIPRASIVVYAPRWDARPGEFEDSIPLANGDRFYRTSLLDGEMVRTDRAHWSVRRPGGETPRSEGDYALVPSAQEVLFEDAHGAGAGALERHMLTLERLTGDGAPVRTQRPITDVGDRACSGTVDPPVRWVPVRAAPWPMPRIQGMPPSVGEARWTYAVEDGAVCVTKLEIDGPWGRARLDGRRGVLSGELQLAESINPVRCEPVRD